MNVPELKPCPFCGVELEHFEGGRRLTHVRHPMNGCVFLSGKDWWKVPRFTDPWNTRADLPPTDAEVMAHPKVKALVEAAKEMNSAFYSNGNVTERHLKACKAGVALTATLAVIQEDKT